MNPTAIQANIDLHTILADTYEQSEPHFRPENKSRVRNKLEELKAKYGGDKLLDLGCGTGFLIALSKDIFAEIHGVDVTQAMINRVDMSSGNITLHLTPAESIPLPDNYFDVVTAYSFLHHVEDYKSVLREAHRVLKPGGVCYTAQDPNRRFWNAVAQLRTGSPETLQPIVANAYKAVLNIDETMEHQFGTPKAIVQAAEPVRSKLGGLDPDEVKQDALEVGFSRCEVRLGWFLGEAEVFHGQSSEAVLTIDRYLRGAAPMTDHLFKYVELTLVK